MLKIEKQSFFELEEIIGIKNYTFNILDYDLKEECIKGNIEININYYNKSQEECFKTFVTPFDIIIDSDISVKNISVSNMTLDLIEGHGFNANIELEVLINETIKPKEEVKENTDIEETKTIKKNIEDDYDKLLNDSLQERNENVKVIRTTDSNVDSFLSFFKNTKESFFNIKCLNVNDEKELNGIAKKYGVSLKDLYDGYDSTLRKVIFKTSD